MSAISKIAIKGVYHATHPLLRVFRRFLLRNKETARILILCKNEILLVRNIGAKKWSLPGGALNKGETPDQCALRELYEELLIDNPIIERKLGIYHSHTAHAHGDVHVFVAKIPSLHHTRGWEIDESRWFELNDLPATLSPATSRRIGEYKNGLSNVKAFW